MPVSVAPQPRLSRPVAVRIALMFMLLLLGGCSKKPSPREIRQVAGIPGAIGNASCTRDGKLLVFQANLGKDTALWTAALDGGGPRLLVPAGARRPSWSPDGSRVVYDSPQSGNSDLWVIPASGGTPRRLTADPAADWDPRWSPDGRWISFMSNRRDSVAIWAVSEDGSKALPVGRPGGANPVWSPDSRRIAYQARSPDGNWDLFAADLAGAVTPLTSGGAADVDPAWSPDGRKIACRIISREGAEIGVVAADGGAPKRLTAGACADGPPVWSPDGTRIAFLSYSGWNRIAVIPADGGKDATPLSALMQASSLSWHPDGTRLLFCAKAADLWTVPAGGGPPVPLTNDLFEDRKPDVSPDGRTIVFESSRDGDPGLWTLDASGGAPRLLLPHPGAADAHPRFSPDGKRIAFTSNRRQAARQTQIWTVAADGSDTTRMTAAGGLKGRPTWYRDSARILFESNLGGSWGLWALDSGRLAPVVQNHPAMRPAWSPDGWWVAYQSERNGNQDLYATQMKTGEERRLTSIPSREGDPAWSRDGRRLAFVSDRSGTDDLCVLAFGTGEAERILTSGPEDDIEPAWFPDGSRIVFVRITGPAVWSVTVPR